MHILIVEDDEVARDYLARALREVGHTVDVAANGLEGLRMASSTGVNLAIVDRMLPKLDGLALVQSLRATGRKMPVLILSALGDVDDRITGVRLADGRELSSGSVVITTGTFLRGLIHLGEQNWPAGRVGEAHPPRQKIFIRQIQRRDHQPADVDLRTRAEQHTIRIDQKNTAVGLQSAEDLRGIDAGDAI